MPAKKTDKRFNNPESQPIFVARQPIFDADGNIWGFELLYRHSDQVTRAEIRDPDQATMSIIADGFSLAAGRNRQAKTLINFPQNLLLSGSIFALPRDRCVIEILEDVAPIPEVVEAVKNIKAQGYTVALDDFTGRPDYGPLLELADIIKVDILDMNATELTRITNSLQPYGATLLAEKVEHKVQFSLARKLGYVYFQGFYFERAEIVSGRKVSGQLLPRLQLIQALARDDYDTDKVIALLSTDSGLTYRLIQFINSAFFALPNPIKNVRQAVTLLGARQLRQWLLAVAVADFDAKPAHQISAETGLLRARFLQQLAGVAGEDEECLFLLGLFSKLDVLFGLPMEELVEELPLDPLMKQALLTGEGGLGDWLRLVRLIEQGHWDAARDILLAQSIPVDKAARTHNAALRWTRETLSAVRS